MVCTVGLVVKYEDDKNNSSRFSKGLKLAAHVGTQIFSLPHHDPRYSTSIVSAAVLHIVTLEHF